jgi:hypothetical protein
MRCGSPRGDGGRLPCSHNKSVAYCYLSRGARVRERFGSRTIAIATGTPTQPHADATAILIDELNAGVFQRSPHHDEGCAPRLIEAGLKLADGDDPDLRLVG